MNVYLPVAAAHMRGVLQAAVLLRCTLGEGIDSLTTPQLVSPALISTWAGVKHLDTAGRRSRPRASHPELGQKVWGGCFSGLPPVSGPPAMAPPAPQEGHPVC